MPALPFAMPRTEEAVLAAAELVQAAWIAAATDLPLSPGQRAAYIAGLESPRSLLYPYNGDPLKAELVNIARNAAEVEYGVPAVHLPDVIDWQGRDYIIVPFRHYARHGHAARSAAARRGMMTNAVYEVARRLQPGQSITAGPTSKIRPWHSRPRRVHAPGLNPYVPAYTRNVRPGYTHAAREEGMRRLPSGGGRVGTYLTYRTMTPHSPGWWLPPRPALHVRDTVERETAPAVHAMLETALRQDIADVLRERLGGRS